MQQRVYTGIAAKAKYVRAVARQGGKWLAYQVRYFGPDGPRQLAGRELRGVKGSRLDLNLSALQSRQEDFHRYLPVTLGAD